MREKMLAAEVNMVLKVQKAKRRFKEFVCNEEGDTNIIAIVLILVVVIALAVIFRDNIKKLVDSIWKKVFADSKTGNFTE
ncbi:MAG: flagellin-like protein [Lachnospiraceae bacterium]|nr:flagellin-like protein [Lachnospiraceae bacterium]